MGSRRDEGMTVLGAENSRSFGWTHPDRDDAIPCGKASPGGTMAPEVRMPDDIVSMNSRRSSGKMRTDRRPNERQFLRFDVS
jgi:hypothetical protein